MIFQAPPSRSSLNLWLRRATFGSVDPTLPIIVTVFPFRLDVRDPRVTHLLDDPLDGLAPACEPGRRDRQRRILQRQCARRIAERHRSHPLEEHAFGTAGRIALDLALADDGRSDSGSGPLRPNPPSPQPAAEHESR